MASLVLSLTLGCSTSAEEMFPGEFSSRATLPPAALMGPGPEQVKDLQSGPNPYAQGASNARKLVSVGGKTFFQAHTENTGSELWVTDGTAAGTQLIKDFTPGLNGTELAFAVLGNQLLIYVPRSSFVQQLPYYELWTSDGTPGGTVLLQETLPSLAPVSVSPVACGEKVFALTGEDALWMTDGTSPGSFLFTPPGLDSLLPEDGTACANGTLFFFANSDGRPALWASDGTAAGTRFVRDFESLGVHFPPWDSGLKGPTDAILAAVGGTVFFSANDGLLGAELWKSDGTAWGTVPVKDIHPFWGSDPSHLTPVGALLYFTAYDELHGQELWKSDGTGEGTVLVTDLAPGQENSWPRLLTALGDKVLFAANAPGSWNDLFISDGTEVGTVLLGSGAVSEEVQPAVVGSRAFFAAQDYSPWTSDGTVAGTVPVSPGTGLEFPSWFTAQGHQLLFAAETPSSGRQLWTADLAGVGAQPITEFGPTSSSLAEPLADVGGKLFFSTRRWPEGLALWTSEGTEQGTLPVKTFGPQLIGTPRKHAVVGNTLFFSSYTELWRSDGTEAGTFRLHGSISAPLEATDTQLAGTVFFAGHDATHGVELWTSDGTAAGTALLKDINPSGRSFPSEMTRVGNALFFVADDGAQGTELWKTDGTAAGTVLVKDILPGKRSSAPESLVAVGNTLFFLASDASSWRELWKSDGTPQGTVRVRSVPPSPNPSYSSLVALGNTLYFFATDAAHGRELWKSDGSDAGTVRVTDLQPGPASSVPGILDNQSRLFVIGGTLYFMADDGLHGLELWKSDGTPGGTALVRDITPGPQGRDSDRTRLVPVGSGGAFAFATSDGVHGVELWKSDGTAAGTQQVADVAVGARSASPGGLLVSGSRLFFVADDLEHGRELWSVSTTVF
jgi:ELWxxDGT repeat protein